MRPRWSDALWECRIGRTVGQVRLLNGRGCEASYTKTTFSVGLEATVVRDTDMLFVWEGETRCRPLKDTATITEPLHRKLEMAQRVVAAPQGEVPVIFTPRGVASVLLGPLLTGFNGRSIVQGASPLVGKLGQEVLDSRITIWDDPTIPYAPGSRACDDEGIPSGRLPLVNEGVIANYLYDLQTAGQAGARSTGSAARSLGSHPSPAPGVVVIQEGDTPYDRMVADIKDGLIVEMPLGAGQGNILGGDFSANVLLGYRVEGGQVTGRVKNTVIAGNVYRALREVVAVGREAQWVGGVLRTPALCCGGVSLSTKV
jgi:PmbA protein